MRIVIVGPCGAGKTTLAHNLEALGYEARDCAQEHSGVQSMWLRVARPDVLIFLDAEAPTIRVRLQVDWEDGYIEEQERRLADARRHADLFLATDALSIQEVLDEVVKYLGAAT